LDEREGDVSLIVFYKSFKEGMFFLQVSMKTMKLTSIPSDSEVGFYFAE